MLRLQDAHHHEHRPRFHYSAPSGARNLMVECAARRQTRPGTGYLRCGQFVLSAGKGGACARRRLPLNFRSDRFSSSRAIRRADPVISSRALIVVGSARPFNHIANGAGDAFPKLPCVSVWRASRCLPVQEFLQGQAHLIGVGRAALGHRRVLSFSASFDASTKARKAFHDVGKTSRGRGQFSQERSHV